jgi:hypothetical protein
MRLVCPFSDARVEIQYPKVTLTGNSMRRLREERSSMHMHVGHVFKRILLSGFGTVLIAACLPGCDSGSEATSSAPGAAPGQTKAAQAEKTGIVGPKTKHLPPSQ